MPSELLATATVANRLLQFGGDVRIGDLSGNGQVDFLVYRSAEGGMKRCFLGAFTRDGKVLWQAGGGGTQPARPGPVAIYDVDADGKTEVVCFFRDPSKPAPPGTMENVVIQIREGTTGRLEREAAPEALRKCRGEGANWVHQRILIANFRGTPTPRDFLVKLGDTLLAFDQHLELLWSYRIAWNQYSRCSAYIPAVGDIDGNGRDEVNGGYYLLDSQGKALWERELGRHMDSVAVAEWDNGRVRALCSGYGHVMDRRGNVILRLGEKLVPHGQELRCADFVAERPGPEMLIRYNGHRPDVMLVSNTGEVLRRFRLNESPNNTGMEAVYWNGPTAPALLCNNGILWEGTGRHFAPLPDLPKPVGPDKMGWYHCIPANVCGDEREELLLYNPWDQFIFIYTPAPLNEGAFGGYQPGPRQYNVRLMD